MNLTTTAMKKKVSSIVLARQRLNKTSSKIIPQTSIDEQTTERTSAITTAHPNVVQRQVYHAAPLFT